MRAQALTGDNFGKVFLAIHSRGTRSMLYSDGAFEKRPFGDCVSDRDTVLSLPQRVGTNSTLNLNGRGPVGEGRVRLSILEKLGDNKPKKKESTAAEKQRKSKKKFYQSTSRSGNQHGHLQLT